MADLVIISIDLIYENTIYFTYIELVSECIAIVIFS